MVQAGIGQRKIPKSAYFMLIEENIQKAEFAGADPAGGANGATAGGADQADWRPRGLHRCPAPQVSTECPVYAVQKKAVTQFRVFICL